MGGDAGGPLGVGGRVDRAGRGDVDGALAGEQCLRVGRLARAGAPEDEEAQLTGVPALTRGAGMRSLRIWVARVKAYQPVEKPRMSSFGNFARTEATI